MSDPPLTSSGRPKRSIVCPARYSGDGAPSSSASRPARSPRPKARPRKRKAGGDDDDDESSSDNDSDDDDDGESSSDNYGGDNDGPNYELYYLLHNPQSMLTQLDISDLINADTWGALSPSARAHLARLLPPTAFSDYKGTLDASHPSQRAPLPTAHHQAPPSPSSSSSSTHDPALLLPAFFSDSHFLGAAHTFQTHLSGALLGAPAGAIARRWLSGVRAGHVHFPWKDEMWAREHREGFEGERDDDGGDGGEDRPGARAGHAVELRLRDLLKHGVLRAGDLLAYKRVFTMPGLTVEKDVIIETIDPKTHCISMLIPPGTLTRVRTQPDALMRRATVSSPTQLESAILDIDGRVERSQRPRGNAWKSFVVWRPCTAAHVQGRGDMETRGEDGEGDTQAGRENCGTLFYLRGCLYQER